MKFKTSLGCTLVHIEDIVRISYDGEIIIADSIGYTQEVPATDQDYNDLLRLLTGL